MSSFRNILDPRDSSQTDQSHAGSSSSGGSKSTVIYLSIFGVLATLVCIYSVSRAWKEAMLRRRERLLRASEVPMGGPAGASEAEKEDSDGEEVEPPRMYEIFLQKETCREGTSVGLPAGSCRGGWANVGPVSSSIVSPPVSSNAMPSVPTAGQQGETKIPLGVAPTPLAQRSVVTSVLIAMPGLNASEITRKRRSDGISGETTLPADRRLADVFFGVHEALEAQNATPSPQSLANVD
ncbi:hypothetical protein FS837_011893 [Tulasnella sp. UAMH 9824]|nr:hypothetical protein FS837_011893 [Tulasnella sp. UAMH 9824]